MARGIGAQPYGNWSGCHSVAWDINAPPYGDLTVGDQFQKHNYPFGILVNAKGERYVDEGANFHSHTYAKYGGEIVRLPGMFAWQVFDAKVSHLLRGEYRIRRVTKAEAGTLEELAEKLDGVDAAAFLRTVHEFNAACRTGGRRSIRTCWMAAGRRASPSTRQTGPIRSILRPSTPIT
jgi:tricarballylate dehydrogenase